MKNPLRKKKVEHEKMDLMPEGKNGEKTLDKGESIVEQARKVAAVRSGKVPDKSGSKAARRTNDEIEADKKLQELSKAVDKALADNFGAAVKLATIGLAKLADDKFWIATDEESQQLAVCVRGYIDLKFPGWGTESPGGALALAAFAFILPRLAPHKKQRMEGNTWAGWLPKVVGWFRPKKPAVQSTLEYAAGREIKPTEH